MFTGPVSHYHRQHAVVGAVYGHQQRPHNGRNANRRHSPASVPDESGREPKHRELSEFLSNFTLHCYRWLAPGSGHNGWVMTLWLLVHMTAGLFIGVILVQAYHDYSLHPLVTTLADTLHPVGSVPFPAISVCSNNRLSRRMAELYAAELFSSDANRSTSPADRLADIRYMGTLIDSDWHSANDLSEFQAFLDRFDSNETFYNTNAHMRTLVPQCKDLLLKCSWRGVEQPCMQRGLMFAQRSTQYGHCCTFNYVRTDSLSIEEEKSIHIDDTGPELGLILLLNGSSKDYFYPLYNFVGFIVQIFDPNEFPDVPSGSVSEILVELGYETYIRIDSTTVESEPLAQSYAPETRGCLFVDELADQFGGRYKRSDCLVNCRIFSIMSLCNCIIYYLPGTQVGSADEQERRRRMPRCTLEHVECLNRYRIKWSTVLLTLEPVVGLEVEQEEGLYCPQCLPSCSDTTYLVSYQDLPLVSTHRREPNFMSNVTNVSDVALIRIYLGQPDTWLYKQKVSLAWHEIISNIGGMCGVVSGFSLISLAEVLYYATRQIYLRYCRSKERPLPTMDLIILP